MRRTILVLALLSLASSRNFCIRLVGADDCGSRKKCSKDSQCPMTETGLPQECNDGCCQDVGQNTGSDNVAQGDAGQGAPTAPVCLDAR